MSGIVGIFMRDDSPVDRNVLERMLDAVAYRGPDARNTWLRGSVGLGHALLRTTPESFGEHQPCTLDGQVWIAADARIDNRDDLLRDLPSSPLLDVRSAADSLLLLHAYHTWGDACLSRIVGNYAFILWDSRNRKAVCARDPLGVRRLYYHDSPRRLVLGTDIRAILAVLDGTPALNEPLLKDHLCDYFGRYQSETVYQNIFPIRAGHCLTLRERLTHSRFHQWGNGRSIKYRRCEEYTDHFRELFSCCVTSCARSHSPVGVMVSGGLDSSSIAATLNVQQQRASDASLRRVFLYATVSDTMRELDERVYLDAIVRWCAPWPVRMLKAEELWALRDHEADYGMPHDEPDQHLFRRFPLDTYSQARADGCRVLLTGEGGDHTMVHGGYCHGLTVDPLLRILTHLPAYARWSDGYGRVRQVLGRRVANGATAALKPLVPPPVWELLRRGRQLVRRRSPDTHDRRASWVVGHEPMRPAADQHAGLGPMAPFVLRSFQGMWTVAVNEIDRADGLYGMESRMPYVDQRIVDYVVTLPSEALFSKGFNRALQRGAMRGLMPEEIRVRTSKAVFDEIVRLGWCDKERMRIAKLIDESILAEWGWIEREPLRAAFKRYCAGIPIAWPLGAWINVELWLRSRGISTSHGTGAPVFG